MRRKPSTASSKIFPGLVIFDLDGTLVDAYGPIERSFNYAMKRLGYPPEGPLTIRRAVGWGDQNLLRPFVGEKDLKDALSIYRAHHRKALLRGVRLLPGARKILRCLKDRGVKLAIASNRPTRFTKIILRAVRIERFFDYVLCADKLANGKPHPEIILRIMRKLKARPAETLYVGDMTIDIKAAKNAKVESIAVLSGSSTKKELLRENPYRIFRDVSGLIEGGGEWKKRK